MSFLRLSALSVLLLSAFCSLPVLAEEQQQGQQLSVPTVISDDAVVKGSSLAEQGTFYRNLLHYGALERSPVSTSFSTGRELTGYGKKYKGKYGKDKKDRRKKRLRRKRKEKRRERRKRKIRERRRERRKERRRKERRRERRKERIRKRRRERRKERKRKEKRKARKARKD